MTTHWNLVMAYAGFILVVLVVMFVVLGLLDRQMNRNDEKLRAKAAKELGKRLDRTSSGTAIFWAVDDPTPDEVLLPYRTWVPDDEIVDPPVRPRYYDSGWTP